MKRFWSSIKNGITKKSFAAIILFLILSIAPAFLLIPTRNYQLDYLSYQINNYNKTSMLDDDFQPSVLTVEKKENNNLEKFQTLYKNFYYNPTNGIVRIKSSQTFYCDDTAITLLSQPTFSIYENENSSGFYDLEYRLFDVLYCNEIFEGRDYLKPRDGCDTFVFVSDTFANKLIEKYDLQDVENPYIELIKNYYKLNFSSTDGKVFSASINNIIVSSTRTGPRTKILFDHYALVYESTTTLDELLNFNFEIELKDNAFCIKKTINDIDALNYSYKDYNYSIFKYDHQANGYSIDSLLTSELNQILPNKHNELFATFFYLVSIFLPLIYFLVCKYLLKISCYSFIDVSYLFILLIFGIICNFCYIYFYWTLPFILMSISILLLSRKEVGNAFKYCFGKSNKNNKIQMESFCTIQI